jgi:hypothetical protein
LDSIIDRLHPWGRWVVLTTTASNSYTITYPICMSHWRKPLEAKNLCGRRQRRGGAEMDALKRQRPTPAEQVGFCISTPIPTPPSQCRALCPRGVGPSGERGNEGAVTSEWVVLWSLVVILSMIGVMVHGLVLCLIAPAAGTSFYLIPTSSGHKTRYNTLLFIAH